MSPSEQEQPRGPTCVLERLSETLARLVSGGAVSRQQRAVGITLRYPYEIRKEDQYFDDIENEKIPKDMMELASHIVETKSGHFNPQKFEDHYEEALKELLKISRRPVSELGPQCDLIEVSGTRNRRGDGAMQSGRGS